MVNRCVRRRAALSISNGAARLLLSIGLLGATHAPLQQAIQRDPLYPVLQQYDREIAALRATESAPGLTQIGRRIAAASAAVRHETVAARTATKGGTPTAPSHATIAEYQRRLGRQTDAAIAAYRQSIATRTQRALAARAQQLRERESTLSFDLAQRDASKETALRLKLHYLHLFPQARAQLEGRLHALQARDASAVAAARSSDGAALAAYRAQLDAQESRDVATMTARLRRDQAANLAIRKRALANGGGRPIDPRTGSIVRAFASTQRDANERYTSLARQNAKSYDAARAQLAALEADRAALYRFILERAKR